MARQLRTAFKAADINAVHGGAIGAYLAMPARCRLPDMNKDLTEEEKRTIAFFVSSLQHLIRLGVLSAEQGEALFPEFFTKVNQVDDEETISFSADARGVVKKK